jgi:hypothetical protein
MTKNAAKTAASTHLRVTRTERNAFWWQHDDQLRRLRAEGVTYAEIARQLDITRGTALGRARRIGLSGDDADREARREVAAARRRAKITKLREELAELEAQERRAKAEAEA